MSERAEHATHQIARRSWRLPAWATQVGIVVGVALLVAAIVAAAAQKELMRSAWQALSQPSWPRVALLLICVLANIVLSGLMFSALVSRYGRVGVIEMQALIAVATLLNFLPVRPGMFGRVAYHRAVNRIRAVDAGKTVIQGAAISAAVALVLAALAIICAQARWPLWPTVIAGAAILGVLTISLALRIPALAQRSVTSSSSSDHQPSIHEHQPSTRAAQCNGQRSTLVVWPAAILCRYLDVLVWSLRYWVAFALIGNPIGWDASIALACVGIIATMTPIGANGLGLREWAVGLVAPYVSESTLASAITAELVNRAAEIAVVLVAGAAGAAWLARRHGPGWVASLRGGTGGSGGP